MLPAATGNSYAAAEVYDARLGELFISNPGYNEVDVYSATDLAPLGAIPVPGPVGLSVSPDGATLVIGTETPYIYVADAAALKLTATVPLPASIVAADAPDMPMAVFAMSDGTCFVALGAPTQSLSLEAVQYLLRYDPKTQAFTPAAPSANGILGLPARSGDGNFLLVPTSQKLNLYSIAARAYTATAAVTGAPMAANANGTEFAVLGQTDNGEGGFNSVVTLPGAQLQPIGQYAMANQADGPPVFSGGNVYLATPGPWYVLSASTAQPVGFITAGTPDDYPGLFAAGANGQLFAADRRDVYIVNVAQTSATPATIPQFSPPADLVANPTTGPVAGGTPVQFVPTSVLGANAMASSEEAYFGAQPATQDVVGPYGSSSDGTACLTATAPRAAAPGPVTVVLADAAGDAVLLPDGYTYGPSILKIEPNTAPAAGGENISIFGYGLGYDFPGAELQDTASIGGNTAQIIPNPISGTFGEQVITVVVPPGMPGWADVTLNTPSGSYTLRRGLQYLRQDVRVGAPVSQPQGTEYGPFVLYDAVRNLFYLTGNSSGNAVAVFNPATASFQAPLQSSAASSGAILAGEALTPDDSDLVVADPADESAIVFDLQSGGSQAAQVLLPSDPVTTPEGKPAPIYVNAAADGRVFVTMQPCIPDPVRELDLSTLAVTTRPDAASTCTPYVPYPSHGAATAGGGTIIFGGSNDQEPPGPESIWRYDAASDLFTGPVHVSLPSAQGGVAVDADASVVAVGTTVLDSQLQPLVPTTGYGGFPVLNATGSLLYACAESPDDVSGTGDMEVDITAAQTGRLLLSIALPGNCGADEPLAINPAGDEILIPIGCSPSCGGGDLFVQLAAVPLAIGSVSPAQATAGATVTISGSGFAAGLTATIGGQVASCAVNSPEAVACTVPAGLEAGPAGVAFTGADGETAVLPIGFTVQ